MNCRPNSVLQIQWHKYKWLSCLKGLQNPWKFDTFHLKSQIFFKQKIVNKNVAITETKYQKPKKGTYKKTVPTIKQRQMMVIPFNSLYYVRIVIVTTSSLSINFFISWAYRLNRVWGWNIFHSGIGFVSIH